MNKVQELIRKYNQEKDALQRMHYLGMIKQEVEKLIKEDAKKLI